MSKNIVVVGSSNTDMVIKTDPIPRLGETFSAGKERDFGVFGAAWQR